MFSKLNPIFLPGLEFYHNFKKFMKNMNCKTVRKIRTIYIKTIYKNPDQKKSNIIQRIFMQFRKSEQTKESM